MDRVVYSPGSADMLVWLSDASDIIVWDVETLRYIGNGLCFQNESIRTPSVINESIRGC